MAELLMIKGVVWGVWFCGRTAEVIERTTFTGRAIVDSAPQLFRPRLLVPPAA